MSERRGSKAGASGLPWMMAPLFLPFWLAAVEWGWWRVFHREWASAPVPDSVLPPPALAAGLAVAGKLLGHLSEAALFVLLWRARGARLPFWRFLVVVISASMADQLAYSLSAPFASGGAPAWRAWLAGLHLAWGTPFHDSPAVRAGFGSVGALTAARIAITAGAQARAVERPWVEAMGWTILVWLISRLAAMWGLDLMRGMSPVSEG